MNSALLKRLLALAEKTGDRLVVVEGDRAVVLLPIDKYEELLGWRQRSAAADEEIFIPKQDSFGALDFPESKPDSEQSEKAAGANFLDDLADEPGEEQFYLEPVD